MPQPGYDVFYKKKRKSPFQQAVQIYIIKFFIGQKNSANEQNASLLAGFFSECNLFWRKANRMFYNFSGERSGLRNREKEENRQF